VNQKFIESSINFDMIILEKKIFFLKFFYKKNYIKKEFFFLKALGPVRGQDPRLMGPTTT
jgi:hypothetical protein